MLWSLTTITAIKNNYWWTRCGEAWGGQKEWIWLLWLLFTGGISRVNHLMYCSTTSRIYLFLPVLTKMSPVPSCLYIFFFLVPCKSAYIFFFLVFPGNLNMQGKKKTQIYVCKSCKYQYHQTAAVKTHLTLCIPQPFPLKRQYLQQIKWNVMIRFCKWNRQSKGFPDCCCFSVKNQL